MRCSPSHACYKEDIQPYENHPAILSQTEPLTLFVLADLGGGEVEPIYGLRRFRVKALPGHSIATGERVPCAAMYESSKTHLQQFLYYRIHPYCWATFRPEHIEAWTSAIPEMEWNLLEASMAAYPNLEDGEIIELRVDGTPIGRRYYREDILNKAIKR